MEYFTFEAQPAVPSLECGNLRLDFYQFHTVYIYTQYYLINDIEHEFHNTCEVYEASKKFWGFVGEILSLKK